MYKQSLDLQLHNSENQYKQQLDLQLQGEIERIKSNYDYCTQVKIKGLAGLIEPLQKQLETILKINTIGNVMPIYGILLTMGNQNAANDNTNLAKDVTNKISQLTDAFLAKPCTIQVLFMGPPTARVVDTESASSRPNIPAQQVAPAQVPAQQATPPQNSEFQNGVNDRNKWESWFAGLQYGDYRSGASYWSSHRTGNPQGSCFDKNHASYGDFTKGCLEAKKFLDQADQSRASSLEYKNGWNSVSTPQKAKPTQCSVIGVKPDDHDGGLRIHDAVRGGNVIGTIPYNGRGITNEGCACDGETHNPNRCRISYKGLSGWVAENLLFPD